MGRIQSHDDTLPVIEFHNAIEVVRTGSSDRGGGKFHFASQYACHLFYAIHTQARLDAIDIDDKDAGPIGLFRALHAEACAHIDDWEDDAAQIGDTIDVRWRARDFRQLRKANDFLHRHDVKAELFVLQQKGDELAFFFQVGVYLYCV